MDLITGLVVLMVILVSGLLLFWLTLRLRTARGPAMRELSGFATLSDQIGRAVESGRGVHFSAGRGGLVGRSNPASVAALNALDYVAESACKSDVPPLVSVGDATLLVASQDSLRGAFETAGRANDFSSDMAQFVAGESFPTAFAAGVSDMLNRGDSGSNLLFGRFGAEVAIIGEAADRADVEQVVGSDDPIATAVGVAYTDKVLIGEEMFTAGAYLQGGPPQRASVILQDIMRVIVAIAILLAAILNLFLGQ
jgi:hypothetical protein